VGGFSYNRAACAIVGAIYTTDESAAAKFETTTRTIRRWRERMAGDERLCKMVEDQLDAREELWARQVPEALDAGLRFIQRASLEADTKCPETIRSMVGALKICAEIKLTRDLIAARIRAITEQYRETDSRDDEDEGVLRFPGASKAGGSS